MPCVRRFRVLTTTEFAKLLAEESGLTERESLRVFRSVTTVLRKLLLSGYGVPMGEGMILEPKPIKARQYRHPADRKLRTKAGRWIVKLRVSAAFNKLLIDTLEEPSEEEIEWYERGHNSYKDKIW